MPKKSKNKKVSKKISFRKEIVYLCSCCAVILIALLTTANMNQFVKTNNVLGANNKIIDETPQMLQNQKEYWLSFLDEHPGYLDGWIELTRISLEQGDTVQARIYFDKANEISPNSSKIMPYKEVFK